MSILQEDAPEVAEMASKVSSELGIEAAPLAELVERAAAMIGLDMPEDVPLTERLRTVHEELCCHAQLANIPVEELDGDNEALRPYVEK